MPTYLPLVLGESGRNDIHMRQYERPGLVVLVGTLPDGVLTVQKVSLVSRDTIISLRVGRPVLSKATVQQTSLQQRP